MTMTNPTKNKPLNDVARVDNQAELSNENDTRNLYLLTQMMNESSHSRNKGIYFGRRAKSTVRPSEKQQQDTNNI